MSNITYQDMLLPFVAMMICLFLFIVVSCCMISAIAIKRNAIRQRAKERELIQRSIELDSMYEHVNTMYEIVGRIAEH